MDTSKSTLGLTAEQLANGTPNDRLLVLKSFYKDDKCTISPAKDANGRYLGINENIPEIKKLEMGYVPTINSKLKLYDGIEIDLNNATWAKDWEWMQHCAEIADDFQTGQSSPSAYFYIFRPGFESAKKVSEAEKRWELMNYVLTDTNENLYNRASILGVDMTGSVVSDVKDFLLSMINTEPAKIRAVYESKTYALELLFMHALKKEVISNRSGVYTFGEMLLGVEDKAVVAFFANPNNLATTRAIEAVTYGVRKKVVNPLEHESRSGEEEFQDISTLDETLKVTTLDQDWTPTQDEEAEGERPAGTVTDMDATLGGVESLAAKLTPQQKAAQTRAANMQAAKK